MHLAKDLFNYSLHSELIPIRGSSSQLHHTTKPVLASLALAHLISQST
jgi:hypothetical protein